MDLFDVYSLYDIEPVRGRGSYVFTADGTPYLDLYGGHAVISIGHSHPRYVKAVSDQVANLGFYSNSVKNSLQLKLAEMLGEASGYKDYQLFMCNSGAEANENALKTASFHTGRAKVLAFRHAFHGRTSGAVASTDYPAMRAPFNVTDKVEFIPLNDTEAARRELETREYAAVISEGIQGVAGIHEPDPEFLRQLENICQETGTLLILDEIQSGYGRTGRFFAHQHAGIKPNIITCAKGIANGLPCAAVLINPNIPASKGMLGTTFGGNHLACAAAISVLEIMADEHLVENAANIGSYLLDELRRIPELRNVRGRGLMIGFEIEGCNGSEFRKRLLFGHNVFTGGAGVDTVRLLPALSLSRDEADIFLSRLRDAIAEINTNKK